MNISPLTIYLWQLADPLKIHMQIATMAIAVVGGISLICAALAAIDGASENTIGSMCKWGKAMMIAGLSVFMAASFIPSSNAIAMMVVIPQIAESKIVKTDLPDLYNAAVEALKSSLKKP